MCIHDNHNHSCLPNYNTRWVVLVSAFDLDLFVVTMWHLEKTSRPKHARGIIGGNYT